MTNDEISRFFNTPRAFIQGNPDLRDPQVEGWFRVLVIAPNHGKLWKSLIRAHLGNDEDLARESTSARWNGF